MTRNQPPHAHIWHREYSRHAKVTICRKYMPYTLHLFTTPSPPCVIILISYTRSPHTHLLATSPPCHTHHSSHTWFCSQSKTHNVSPLHWQCTLYCIQHVWKWHQVWTTHIRDIHHLIIHTRNSTTHTHVNATHQPHQIPAKAVDIVDSVSPPAKLQYLVPPPHHYI